MTKNRLIYIDNLRLLVIILVVITHLALTYSGQLDWGDWYYIEPAQMGIIQTGFFGFYLAFTQGFFMGLLFLIAGFFIPDSYEKKGFGRFLKDRIIRLGIPAFAYMLIINPLLYIGMLHYRYPGLYIDGFLIIRDYFFGFYFLEGAGTLWFAYALLLFSAIYALYRKFTAPKAQASEKGFPANIKIFALILLISVCAFILRAAMPIRMQPADPPVPVRTTILNIKPGYLSQYVILFIIGIKCRRYQWFDKLEFSRAKPWLVSLPFISFSTWVSLMLIGGAYYDFAPYYGGITWQNAAFAIWESYVSVSMSISLIALSKEKFNAQNKLIKIMSDNSFSVYVCHTPIIIGLTLLFAHVSLPPVVKFFMLVPVGIAVCFLFTYLAVKYFTVKRIPFLRNIR